MQGQESQGTKEKPPKKNRDTREKQPIMSMETDKRIKLEIYEEETIVQKWQYRKVSRKKTVPKTKEKE